MYVSYHHIIPFMYLRILSRAIILPMTSLSSRPSNYHLAINLPIFLIIQLPSYLTIHPSSSLSIYQLSSYPSTTIYLTIRLYISIINHSPIYFNILQLTFHTVHIPSYLVDNVHYYLLIHLLRYYTIYLVTSRDISRPTYVSIHVAINFTIHLPFVLVM